MTHHINHTAIHAINITVFAIGWILYVLAQAQNSVKSNTNGLTGKAGWIAYLRANGTNLATRAFFSALAYGFIVDSITDKVKDVMGSTITSTTIAGIGGYSANALLYQFFGLFPGLRVEVSQLSPPGAPPGPAKPPN
jgi:hypothetical protein